MTEAPERLAADIIAKCVAKGTVGGAYVPADLCKRAFPAADHTHFPAALSLLTTRGYILWHKGKSCFGLDPEHYLAAFDFAMQHASEKRRALLERRDPEIGRYVQTETDDSAQWEEDTLVTRDELLSELRRYVPESTLNARLAAAAPREPSAPAPEMGANATVLAEVHGLRDDVNALGNRLAAVREIAEEARRLASRPLPTANGAEAPVSSEDDKTAMEWTANVGDRLAHIGQGMAYLMSATALILAVHRHTTEEGREKVQAVLEGLTSLFPRCPCGTTAVRFVPDNEAIQETIRTVGGAFLCGKHATTGGETLTLYPPDRKYATAIAEALLKLGGSWVMRGDKRAVEAVAQEVKRKRGRGRWVEVSETKLGKKWQP